MYKTRKTMSIHTGDNIHCFYTKPFKNLEREFGCMNVVIYDQMQDVEIVIHRSKKHVYFNSLSTSVIC